MTDINDLSREIAVTSDDWMVPGVRCVCPNTGAAWRMTAAMAYGWAPDNATAYGDQENEDSLHLAMAAGPDLNDSVTVNALLGSDGDVARLEGKQSFLAVIGDGAAWSIDRTEAICRAWIAAQKGKGNG